MIVYSILPHRNNLITLISQMAGISTGSHDSLKQVQAAVYESYQKQENIRCE